MSVFQVCSICNSLEQQEIQVFTKQDLLCQQFGPASVLESNSLSWSRRAQKHLFMLDFASIQASQAVQVALAMVILNPIW